MYANGKRLVLIGRIARRSERTYRKCLSTDRRRQLFEEPVQYDAEPQPATSTTLDRSGP